MHAKKIYQSRFFFVLREMLQPNVDLRTQLHSITCGFTCYRQSKPCSLALILSLSTPANIIDDNYAPHSYFILLLNLRVLLVVNEWYAQEEHCYFRNLKPVQFKQFKKKTPSVILANINPCSIFLLAGSECCEPVPDGEATFFSHMC